MNLKKFTTNSLPAVMLIAVSLLASCDNDDYSAYKINECLVSSITVYEEENLSEYGYSFSYDSNYRLSRFNNTDGGYFLFTYNSNGKISKIETHNVNNRVNYLQFTWEGNKVTSQWYWDNKPSNEKSVIEFNSNNEIFRVERYYKYSFGWNIYNYSIYSWENGNITKIESYSKDYFPDKEELVNKRNSIKVLFFRENHTDDLYFAESTNKYSSNDFVNDFTSTFEYDDMLNPFSVHHALGLLEMWFAFFHSKSNIVLWEVTNNLTGDLFSWQVTGTIPAK
jgi:hypothetical protein